MGKYSGVIGFGEQTVETSPGVWESTVITSYSIHYTKLYDSFKLWAEQIFGWYYFVERSIYVKGINDKHGHYEKKMIKKRLVNKQYLIVSRGAAKSMYASEIQSYFLNIDPTTTYQITTAPTMKQADEVMSPIKTS